MRFISVLLAAWAVFSLVSCSAMLKDEVEIIEEVIEEIAEDLE